MGRYHLTYEISYLQPSSICLKLFKKIGANHYTSKSVADGLSYPH